MRMGNSPHYSSAMPGEPLRDLRLLVPHPARNMFDRVRRKLGAICRYPELAYAPGDRRDLWLLALTRNRLLRVDLAARLTTTGSRVIEPRLKPARGQPVGLELGNYGQVDCFDELFLACIYNLDAVPFAPDLVVDCGAYCGYFSAMAAGYFPTARLVCFEANPDNLPKLRAQLELLTPAVELSPAAVYLRDGLVTFTGGGMGGSICNSATTKPGRKVPCVDFPRWLRESSPQRLVWKLDIEGAEADLLPATFPYLPHRTVCFLETHYPDEVCAALLAPYRQSGFSIQEVRRRRAGSGGFDYVEWLLIRV